MNLRYYVYIDEDAINSLYNQISKNIISKKIMKKKVDKDNYNANVEAGLEGVLSSQFQGSLEFEDTYSVETQINISLEEKIDKLLQLDDIKETSFLRIREIIDHYQPINESVIFCGQGIFNLSCLYSDDSVSSRIINEPKLIKTYSKSMHWILEYGHTDYNMKYIDEAIYDFPHGDYRIGEYIQDYKSPYGVIMHLSGDKMRKNIRHLTHTIEMGKGFKFFVFGQLVYDGGIYYSLKPFAIWQ